MLPEFAAQSLFVGLVAAVLLSVGLTLVVQRWYAGWQRRRRWLRASAAESKALAWLQQLGYEVLGAQVEGSYIIVLDGVSTPVLLRADYIVARQGLLYVAEVKSGKLAPKLSNAATRRQLLEYLLAFGVDGVLLVDGETRRVHEVVFPVAQRPNQAKEASRIAPYLAWAFVIIAIVGWYWAR